MTIERYTNPRMGAIWSAQRKVDLWWQVELAVCEAWAERGRVPAEAVEVLREGKVDLALMNEYEKQTDHDVIAFIKAATDSLSDKDAARYVHLGLTSSDVVDTALAMQIREAMDLIVEGVEGVRVTLAAVALGRLRALHVPQHPTAHATIALLATGTMVEAAARADRLDGLEAHVARFERWARWDRRTWTQLVAQPVGAPWSPRARPPSATTWRRWRWTVAAGPISRRRSRCARPGGSHRPPRGPPRRSPPPHPTRRRPPPGRARTRS